MLGYIHIYFLAVYWKCLEIMKTKYQWAHPVLGYWFFNATLQQMEPGFLGEMVDFRVGEVHDKTGICCGAKKQESAQKIIGIFFDGQIWYNWSKKIDTIVMDYKI